MTDRYTPPELPAESALDLPEYLEMFAALGHELRYRILATLLAEGELNAASLEAELEAPSNKLHYHLEQLQDAGLVTNRKCTERGEDGVHSYYDATGLGETLMRAAGQLIETERRRLAGPNHDVPGRRRVEREHGGRRIRTGRRRSGSSHGSVRGRLPGVDPS